MELKPTKRSDSIKELEAFICSTSDMSIKFNLKL